MPKNILTSVALYSLIFLIFFFLTAVIFSQVILKGETVTVPDLTGMTITQARTELLKKDLSLAQSGSQFNDRWDRGDIVLQDPAPGSTMRVTKIVRVVTSSGSQRVTVPDLTGKSQESALSNLAGAGLYRGKLTQIHTPRFPAGRIIAQKPAPDEVVDRNSPVGLLISQGENDDRYVMPDLIGGKADRLLAKLKALDFVVTDIHYVHYPGRSSGYIVRQYPPSGYRIQKRNLITIEVSR